MPNKKIEGTAARKPKHRLIYERILAEITSGAYGTGDRLPSEAQLTRRFETSRPTVARALRDLQHHGLLERRAGSGSYVRPPKAVGGNLFGLLVPGLGQGGIFDPICAEIVRASQVSNYTVLWGDAAGEDLQSRNRQAEILCEQYITQKVAGVFFEPLELMEEKDEINERIVTALARAGIPVIMIDRDIYTYPRRSEFDVVAVDNRRAGYLLADHLLALGCHQIEFLALPGSASTVDERILGYQDALRTRGITPDEKWVHWGDPADSVFVRQLMEGSHAEAYICANDDTATALISQLTELGVNIPRSIRVVGIGDVNRYSTFLSVPLTTLHMPCRELGAAALKAMLDRIDNPQQPPRDIRLQCRLVIRESCGAKLRPRKARQISGSDGDPATS